VSGQERQTAFKHISSAIEVKGKFWTIYFTTWLNMTNHPNKSSPRYLYECLLPSALRQCGRSELPTWVQADKSTIGQATNTASFNINTSSLYRFQDILRHHQMKEDYFSMLEFDFPKKNLYVLHK
jgi:hypothetical protein